MTDEQRRRIHDIEYSCDSREELSERIVALEDKLAMYENDHQIALRTYGSWKRLKAEVPKLREENAKLREELAKARDPQRIGGQADPSSFVYAIEQLREFRWQHATNDEEAIPYINNVAAAHERENDKLREHVVRLQVDWESERDYADQMEAKEKMAVAENAKLREVLESVLKCAGEIKRDSGCDTCPMYNQDGSFADGSWCRLSPELRNLGFEVEPMQRRRG